MIIIWSAPNFAHHVLGRPAYSLNEDSTTPPSMQVETRIGDYYVTYMAFPAFPKPKHPGRVNVYISKVGSGQPFEGEVTFRILSNSLFSKIFGSKEEYLGTQAPDDNVFRQGFEFSEGGKFIIRAEFDADGELYQVDFPLQIGEPSKLGPIGFFVAVILFLLLAVNLTQRKRLVSDKIRSTHENKDH
jgi:hypothetical protein